MAIPEKQLTKAEREAVEKDLNGAGFDKYKSFTGRYGFSITFGPRIKVGVGTAHSDGEGNFTAKLKLKYPCLPKDFKPTQQFWPLTAKSPTLNLTQWLKGTYEVNPDGTGHAKVGITMMGTVDGKEVWLPGSGQASLPGAFDYTVLRAQEIGGVLVGVEMQGIDTTPAFDVEHLLRTAKDPKKDPEIRFYYPPQIGVSWFERFPD